MFRVRQQIGCTDEVVDSGRGRGFSRENAIRVAILDTGIGNHPGQWEPSKPDSTILGSPGLNRTHY